MKLNLEPLNKVFTVVLVLLFILAVFLLGDIILSGIVALVVAIWDKSTAESVFKWITLILFIPQTFITIPTAVKCVREGDDESGT